MRFGGRRSSLLSPDPDLIRALAQLLAENGLTEIEYAVGDHLIRVSRSVPAAAAAPVAPTAPSPAGSAPGAAPANVPPARLRRRLLAPPIWRLSPGRRHLSGSER